MTLYIQQQLVTQLSWRYRCSLLSDMRGVGLCRLAMQLEVPLPTLPLSF